METFGYRVLFGQQTRWIKASGFIVHQVMDGSFKLQYAPKEKVADLRLMAGPRGSSQQAGTTHLPGQVHLPCRRRRAVYVLRTGR